MPTTALTHARQLVQEALARPEDLTDEDRASLAALHDEIERLLEQTSETAPSERAGVQVRAERLVERLQRTHPTLTAVLGTLADALMRMGI